MNFSVFHQIPLWLDFIIFVGVLLLSLEVGFRVGLLRQDNWKNAEGGGGRISLNSMFAVLGLMLAFTFGAGLSHHKARKRAIIVETNALGTAYLRAGLVDDPGRSELRQLLLEYARTRTAPSGKVKTVESLEMRIAESWDAKARLWPATERLVQQSNRGPIEASLAVAMTEVIDSDTVRVAAIYDSLPPVVLTMLLLIAAATVSVAGFNAGISGRMSRWRTTLLILVIAAIILVILDFDRPRSGFILVRDDSIRAVVDEMETTLRQGN